MKKSAFVIAAVVMYITVNQQTFAQKSFAGTVTFETKYEGDTDPQKHKTHEAIYSIFENKTKQSLSGGGVSQHVITNGDDLSVTVLLDISGLGRYGKITKKNKEDMFKDVKISFVDRGDSKNICGFECKGYDVTLVDMGEIDEDDEDDVKEIKFIVYTTKEIGKDDNINAFQFPGLSGYPLYIELEVKDVKQITQAKEVKKGKVKAVDFLVPSDYKMFDNDEDWNQEMERLNEAYKKMQGQ